jgi:hypothetical protein
MWTQREPRPFAAEGYTLLAYTTNAGNRVIAAALGGFVFAEQYKPQYRSIPFVDRYNTATGSWDAMSEFDASNRNCRSGKRLEAFH